MAKRRNARLEPTSENIQQVLDDATGMFDNYEKKIYDLNNILRISGLINSTLNNEEMNEKLLYSTQGIVLASAIALFLNRSIVTENYRLTAKVGIDGEVPEIEFDEGEALVQYLKKNRVKAVFTGDLAASREQQRSLDLLAPLNPELLVPMNYQDRLIGFLVFSPRLYATETGKGYNSSDVDFLSNVATFAAIAAENIRLFEMATRDRMTNLFVHHYFQNRLEEEIARALRYDNPLSLIMFDIDHFKSVNDTWGHQAGDIVIKGIAALIRDSLRKLDLPARYGGEEFAVILPEANIAAAVQVAERVRQSVEGRVFEIGGDRQISVTISGGVCEISMIADAVNGSFSGEASPALRDHRFKETLIHSADRALYCSKHAGRNRITVFEGNPLEA